MHALLTSKLDSCNVVLTGLPDKEINKLQRVQNAAVRLVAGAKKQEHITPVLQTLHWLPIRARIDFKILLISYKALNNEAPNYISEISKKYKFCFAGKNLLIVPRTSSKHYGDRAFSVVAPRLWNALPLIIQNFPSVNSFKDSLKTYLFCKHFDV